MSLATAALKGLIRLYQLTLSPWVGRECRYLPTCSQYAMEAVERHGAIRGSLLALGRILRCHPFGGRGYDPVPARFSWRCLCGGCPDDRAQDRDDGERRGNGGRSLFHNF